MKGRKIEKEFYSRFRHFNSEYGNLMSMIDRYSNEELYVIGSIFRKERFVLYDLDKELESISFLYTRNIYSKLLEEKLLRCMDEIYCKETGKEPKAD